MSPEDRSAIATSVANLWTFHATFVSHLMLALRTEGALSSEAIERMLQALDAETDEVLEGPDDQLYAAGLLAVVRARLESHRGG